MDKSAKKLIFSIVYAIVLVSAFVGVFQLLFNGIEMMTYVSIQGRFFFKVQRPQAIILIVGAAIAFLGVILGVIVSCCKNKVVKIICYSLSLAVLISFIILILRCDVYWLEFYDLYGNSQPDYNPLVSFTRDVYPIYSTVKSMLISQTVYFGIMLALYIWDLVRALRKKSLTDQDNLPVA